MSPDRKPPHNVQVLERWAGELARQEGIAPGRVQRWISFMVVAALLGHARDESDDPLFVLKGGAALELRLGLQAPATKDFDTTYRDAVERMLDRLDGAGASDRRRPGRADAHRRHGRRSGAPDGAGGDRGGPSRPRAHILDDGGGRELAYVAMRRARHASHVYTSGSDLRDAAERLAWSWDQERREQWVSDRQHAAERIEALQSESRQLIAMIPPDVSGQLTRLRQEQAALERDLAELRTGGGRWRNTPVGDTY